MSNLVPDGWSKPRLKEVVTHFQNGYAFSAKGYVESGIPIISMGSIQLDGQFKKVNSKLKFWDSGKKEELSRYLVKPCDLIMAMTDVTPTMELIGRSCIVKGESEYFLNQRVGLISFDEDEISKEYFSYYTNFNEWRSYCIGSSGLGAQANLGTSQILDGFVTLPPLPEQQKIAKILTSVDDVIEKTQAQIDKLKDLKTGMMQELLTHGIGHTEFKDSPVGRIPAEWEIVRINELVTKVGSGVTPKGGSKAYVSTGIPLIRSQNVHSDGLRLDNVSFITYEQHQKMKGSQLQPKDVLLNITGASIGRCYYLPDNFTEGNVNQHVCIIRLKQEVISHVFLTLLLNGQLGQSQIMSLQAGGNREGLNFQQIREIKLPLPSLEEQTKISNALSSVERKIQIKEAKLSAVMKTKKALMQDLLTGKVRVKVDS